MSASTGTQGVVVRALNIKWVKRRRLFMLAGPRLMPIIAPQRSEYRVHDDTEQLDIAAPVLVKWPSEVPRPRVGLVQDPGTKPYWTKYRRFLLENSFPLRIVDIHRNSWMKELVGLDVVVWRPGPHPYELEEARRKIFHLNEFLGLSTYPSLRAVSLFNDKILGTWALQHIGAETPLTVASFDEADAYRETVELGPEIVWKTATGAGSSGVEGLNSRGVRTALRRAFSARGRRTYWPYVNQKGYAYAQRLERDLGIDLRITVVGPLLFGYYRDSPRGDFRASGMGLVRREKLPDEALEEAWRIAESLNVGAVAVDFITDEDLQRRKVIEFSSFITVDDPEELVVDGVPGVYMREAAGRFSFREGRYWLPELALAQALGQICGVDTNRLLRESVVQPRAF